MRQRHFPSLLGLIALCFLGLTGCAADTPASRAFEVQELVDRAATTANTILKENRLGNSSAVLREAKAVLIVPSHFRGGLILGAEGGRGVLLAKTTAGTWSPPAVYTLAGGSVGLQLGLESSQVIFIIMNDNALDAILSNNFKFGADMNVAFGPIGGGRGTAFAGGFKPDVYVYSRNRGLFGGGALSGVTIQAKEDWNTAYYGSGATGRAIVQEGSFDQAGTNALRTLLLQP
jgi:lipid-binding SYLF domain-containing protein